MCDFKLNIGASSCVVMANAIQQSHEIDFILQVSLMDISAQLRKWSIYMYFIYAKDKHKGLFSLLCCFRPCFLHSLIHTPMICHPSIHAHMYVYSFIYPPFVQFFFTNLSGRLYLFIHSTLDLYLFIHTSIQYSFIHTTIFIHPFIPSYQFIDSLMHLFSFIHHHLFSFIYKLIHLYLFNIHPTIHSNTYVFYILSYIVWGKDRAINEKRIPFLTLFFRRGSSDCH